MKTKRVVIGSHVTKHDDGSLTLTVTGDDIERRIPKGTLLGTLEYAKDSVPIPSQ